MSKQEATRIEVVYIDTDLIDEPPWNPNEQSPEVFNALVKNIQEVGMLEPIVVVAREDQKGRFWSVSGSHRLKGARVLTWKQVPCVVADSFDEDRQKFQNMRFNLIKGKLDPVRFTKLFDEMSKKYGDEATKALMMFTDKAAFEQVYMSVKASLPKELAKDLDKARDEIKTIDGLASVLNEMFAKYGTTLGHGYMVFSYGGQSHLWVVMDDEVKALADSMKRIAMETGKNINEVFKSMLIQQGVKDAGNSSGRRHGAGRRDAGRTEASSGAAVPSVEKADAEGATEVVRPA